MNRHVISGGREKLSNRLSEQNCNRFQWVVPLLVTAAVYAACMMFGFMRYHTNDDAGIQDYLSGQYTGTPFPGHQFIHIFLGRFISGLYILVPGVEWWFTGCQIIMVCGMLLINCFLLSWTKQNHYPFVPAVLLMILADCSLLCFPVCRTSFTMVAGVIGTGGICLLLAPCRGRKRIVACAGSLVLFAAAFCLRSSVGEALACYYLLAVLILCLKDRGGSLQKAGAFAAAAVVLAGMVAGLSAVNRSYQDRMNGPEFRSFNAARSVYMDYPHDSYNRNPELYAAVGWSRETAWLVNEWCFMDEHVTADSLAYLAQHSVAEKNSIRPGYIKKRFLALQKVEMAQPAEWFWTVAGVFALVSAVLRRKGRLLVLSFANLAGTAVLVLYQLYGGRILYRSLMVCLLPSAVISLALGIYGLKDYRSRRIFRILTWTVLLCIIPVAVSAVRITFDPGTFSRTEILKQRADALGEYALGHPENIYIEDTKTVRDLFPSSPRPRNLIVWGKPDFNSAAQKARLESNGIERLTGDVMKRQNVYFVSDTNLAASAGNGERVPDSSRLLHFYRWLKQEFGAAGIRQEEQIMNNMVVYQFVFEQNEAESEYYDIQSDGRIIAGVP